MTSAGKLNPDAKIFVPRERVLHYIRTYGQKNTLHTTKPLPGPGDTVTGISPMITSKTTRQFPKAENTTNKETLSQTFRRLSIFVPPALPDPDYLAGIIKEMNASTPTTTSTLKEYPTPQEAMATCTFCGLEVPASTEVRATTWENRTEFHAGRVDMVGIWSPGMFSNDTFFHFYEVRGLQTEQVELRDEAMMEDAEGMLPTSLLEEPDL